MDGKTIVTDWWMSIYPPRVEPSDDAPSHDDNIRLAEAIDAAITQARAEEREACAKVLDHRAKSREKWGAGDALRTENETCAKAIRARRS